MSLDGWIRLPKVLRKIRVAELEALRFRMPFMRAADFAYRGHGHASLARSGAGVVGLIETDETHVGGPSKGKTGKGVAAAKHKALVAGAVEVFMYKDDEGRPRDRAGRVRLQAIQDARHCYQRYTLMMASARNARNAASVFS